MTSCGHCGSDREVHGWANGVPLCHPNAGLDCYRLVTVYREPVGYRLPGGPLDGKRDPIRNPVAWAREPFGGYA